MSTLTYRILFLGLLGIFCSCTKNEVLHQDFSLKINQRVLIPIGASKLNIKFSELVEDSRCPPDAYCAWAGQTIVALVVNDSTFIVGPNTSGMSYGSYNIQLLKVNYTNKRHFGEEKYCRIKLRVD